MSTTDKAKAATGYPAAARFFEEITGLFSKQVQIDDHDGPAFESQAFRETVVRLQYAPEAEIEAVYQTLQELSAKIENMRSQVHLDADTAGGDPVTDALRRAHERADEPLSTPDSVKDGEAFIEQMRRDAAEALRRRIERRDLLSPKEFQDRMQISRQSISKAIREGRLFSIIGPSGINYYPAFYTDPRYDRRTLERVAKQLKDIPATVKYHFFTNKAFTLGGKTPLEALSSGQVEAVLKAAAAYTER